MTHSKKPKQTLKMVVTKLNQNNLSQNIFVFIVISLILNKTEIHGYGRVSQALSPQGPANTLKSLFFWFIVVFQNIIVVKLYKENCNTILTSKLKHSFTFESIGRQNHNVNKDKRVGNEIPVHLLVNAAINFSKQNRHKVIS